MLAKLIRVAIKLRTVPETYFLSNSSMTLGPEVVLAGELGMAVLAIGIGHVQGTPPSGSSTRKQFQTVSDRCV